MEIIFATNNAHKLSEVSQILGESFILKTPIDCGITEDIPEEQPTLEGNALQKARYLYERTGCNCFADDTGLEVDALNGAPGVFSARYAGIGHDFAANVNLLLKNMEGVPAAKRSARFRTVIALILDSKEYLFEGEIKGTITEIASGTGGFGYDPIFTPEGYSQTFSELDITVKNSISHRAKAVAKLSDFLKTR